MLRTYKIWSVNRFTVQNKDEFNLGEENENVYMYECVCIYYMCVYITTKMNLIWGGKWNLCFVVLYVYICYLILNNFGSG